MIVKPLTTDERRVVGDTAWRKHEMICVSPDDIENEWVRRYMINLCNKHFPESRLFPRIRGTHVGTQGGLEKPLVSLQGSRGNK